MPQVQRSVVINVPPAKLLEVINDFESYPQFLPEVKKISISNRTPTSADVSYEIDVVKTLRYTLRIETVENGTRWSFLKGDLFKKNSGSWQLESIEDGKKTKATYSLDIEFGGFIPIPSAITGKLTEKSLPGLLDNFKKRAETLSPAA